MHANWSKSVWQYKHPHKLFAVHCVFSICREGGKPVANKPVTFTLVSPGRGTVEVVRLTDANGVATPSQKRDAPEDVSITATATSSKTNLPVSSGAPTRVEWFLADLHTELHLSMSPSSRVPVSTRIQVTAQYFENGKPVAGRNIIFVVRYSDGTTASPSGTTNAQGQTSTSLVRSTASEATVTATTSRTQNNPVSTLSGAQLTW
jgi:hypothetical protein